MALVSVSSAMIIPPVKPPFFASDRTEHEIITEIATLESMIVKTKDIPKTKDEKIHYLLKGS
jgi:hypothetical protein